MALSITWENSNWDTHTEVFVLCTESNRVLGREKELCKSNTFSFLTAAAGDIWRWWKSEDADTTTGPRLQVLVVFVVVGACWEKKKSTLYPEKEEASSPINLAHHDKKQDEQLVCSTRYERHTHCQSMKTNQTNRSLVQK